MSEVVKAAIGSLADATEGLEFAIDSLRDAVGPVPADAPAPELRRAAHNCQAAAMHIAWLALEIARVGAVLATCAGQEQPKGE